MFTMMNLERIIVGIQGLGIAETAYQNSLAYTRERKQGKSNDNKNGETDLIIKHADIRRSLMNMKSIIEGQRSLAFWLSQQVDVSLNHTDENIRKEADEMVSLMTPVVKSFSDAGMEITNEAIQVLVVTVTQEIRALNNCIEIIESHQFMREQILFKQLI